GTAAGKSTGEVGVDASALAEDDSPNDAALRLGDEAAKRLSETLAQPVEWTGVTQIEPGKRSKKCRHAGDRGDERGGAPAQPARASSSAAVARFTSILGCASLPALPEGTVSPGRGT